MSKQNYSQKNQKSSKNSQMKQKKQKKQNEYTKLDIALLIINTLISNSERKY